ncbi:superoxide dismutase [Candidatus Chromulinivorax destructor]|uniref:Superoxide dismutase n=1 Tax=Candidatus Chromulinivorax destructor TaxID=2066483 RepID=A0A345ZCH3_9BACT|nr:superoxide dismutase [Candidatus Chromulinivorax destructor]AXK60990.1 superoxide dismutase [Candidatus Chromulinivorax destructor]
MFKLDSLLYSYDALQPYIDALTMEIHYTKHHQTYIDNLNAAIAKHPELQSKSVYDLLLTPDELPADITTAVINNGGGHYNHTLFWLMMSPQGKLLGKGDVLTAIEKTFGSFEQFKLLFENAAKTRFGSGWAWLAVDRSTGALEIVSTANQDCPISNNKEVILGLDVWEHAYYLHYQNRRADYIAAWWNVVNWGYVQDRYSQILKSL